MRRFIYSFLFCIFLGLVACNDERSDVSTGFLYLGVEEDNTAITTRTIKPITDELLRVDILSTSGDTVRSYADYLKEVKGQKLILPIGNYKVMVSSNENGGAAWESPFYAGETEEPIVVKSGEITNTSLTCKIANTKVTVTYKESLKKFFIDYCDTVSTSAGKLVYTRDEYRAGYFTSEGNLTAKLYLKNKDGNEFTLQRIVKDIKPQYHYNLIYSLDDGSEGEAGSDINISVDSTNPTEINCNISIKQEDLFGKGIPELNAAGFIGDENTLTWKPLKKSEPQELPDPEPVLTLKAPAGIQNIKVKVNSTRFTEENLGIDVDKVITKEGQEIKLNSLLQKAYDWKDLESTETHSFEIIILDQLNQEVTIAFSFVFVPDLDVETLPANAFSTFAFLRGSAEDAENLRFVYWGDDIDESSAIEVTAKATRDGKFEALITDLLPGTIYYYKALAGDTEGNIKEFVTEEATELPDSGFEDWLDPKSGPVPAKDANNIFWGSGNNSMAKTLLVSDNNGYQGKAAKMASMRPPQLFGAPPLGAGNLVTGDFEVVGTTGGKITFNRKFASRPTKLKGYFKYDPKVVDSSGTVNFPAGKKPPVVVTNQQLDECTIYIALSKEPYTINTTDKTSLFDLDMPAFNNRIIAYAELPDDMCGKTIDDKGDIVYKPFELTLKYLQSDYTGPYYIVIVCSAAKYGDYFIGSTTSIMYVDEFKLTYEYDENCFK